MTNHKEKTMIPEITKAESLAYWKEILAGAIEDEQSLWDRYKAISKESTLIWNDWYAAAQKTKRLREKIIELEESSE